MKKKIPGLFYKRLLFLIALCQFSIFNCLAQQSNLELANQYFNTGEYEKAAVYFEKQYSVDPLGTYEPYMKCLALLKDFFGFKIFFWREKLNVF